MPAVCASRRGDAGFSLIEMLVVLAIIAVITTLAYFSLAPLTVRVRLAFERDDFERQLLEMPRRVRRSGRGGVLTDRSGEALPAGTVIAVEGVARHGNMLEEWQALRVDLPQGWRLQVPRPIFYHFSGACEGGRVVLVAPSMTFSYVLSAPLCRPIRDDDAATNG